MSLRTWFILPYFIDLSIMIPTWLDTKNKCVHADVPLENDASVKSLHSYDPLESTALKSVSGKGITEPVTEQHKKQNFRQFLRSLRESKSNESGPWLASTENQDNEEDKEGFTIAHNPRHKKNRQARVSAQQCREENVNDTREFKCVDSNNKAESE